jgi:selenocysteine lyase/cysteine desulfurase
VIGGVMLREDTLARVEAAQRKIGDRSPEQIAADEDFWFDIQQAFAVDRSLINLNNGGVSPASRIAQDAMRRHLELMNNAPARTMWKLLDPQVETVRARLARVFGAAPDEMAITRNASESLEICIYGFDLKPGDEVLTTEHDYPRMITTYKQRALREGIVLKQVPVPAPVASQDELVELFRRAITPRTKILHVSHVVFITGQVFPVQRIGALGREHGIPVIVDGAHAFAHLAFQRDELDCDYYGTSLHKWLMSPIGAGFLYVRRDRIGSLWPLMAAVEPRSEDIRKFEEIGTHPAANRLAIAEALILHQTIGPQRKEARLRYLRDRWARRLLSDRRVGLYTSLAPEHGCGIATLRIEGVNDYAALADFLWNKYHIVAVQIDTANVKGLRITPSVYSTLDEIDLFCTAIEDVLANGIQT